ncbi:MAG: hypothetical protein JNL49_07715 [Bacteroidia bacterium]|nr:hypothetical protein [Bacteroidia bacterium]
MNHFFKIAFKIFKYLSIVFTVLFWIYTIYDDYVFIEKYGLKLDSLGVWFVWYLVYFLAFTLYYWVISSSFIFIYHKLAKRRKVG